MSEIQMAHFSFGGEPRDRSHFHAVAMREARSTTDRREGAAEAAPRRTVAARVRLAFAGPGATTDACSCPA